MSTLPGNPGALKAHADALVESASHIRSAIDELRNLVTAGNALSLTAVATGVTVAANEVSSVERRYRVTGTALQTYQVKLAAAHRQADDAADRQRRAEDQSAQFRRSERALYNAWDNLAYSEAPAWRAQQARNDYENMQYRRRTAEQAAANAQADLNDARRKVDAAAQVAISQIDTVMTAWTERLLNKFKQAFEAVQDVLSSVYQWVQDVLKKVLNLIIDIAKAVWEAVKIMALIIATVVVAVIAAVVLTALIVAVLVAVTVVVALILAVVTVIVAVVILAALYALIKVVDIIIAGALAIIIKPISQKLSEAFSNYAKNRIKGIVDKGAMLAQAWKSYSYEVTRKSYNSEGDRSKFDKYDETMKKSDRPIGQKQHFSRLTTVMSLMPQVDHLGGDGMNDEEAVVSIVKLNTVPPRWIVTLPSTQNWGEGPAPNDGTHNLLLKSYPPEKTTAYEKQILAAMREAGISPTDEVMVQGFSQGGIMAARMAANDNSGFNITRVVTVGSPVADIDIPSKTRHGNNVHVLSMGFENDPVPNMEKALPGDYSNGAGRQHYYLTDPVPGPKIPHTDIAIPFANSEAHNADEYVKHTGKLISSDPKIDDEFEKFLNSTNGGSQVAEHHLVSFREDTRP